MIGVRPTVLVRKVIYVLTVTNMATIRNCEFVSGKCSVAGISFTWFKLCTEMDH
jgi:hypothetical protein